MPKKKRKKLTPLQKLTRRVTSLERQMREVAREAGHAYLHTMRIGAP